MKQLPTMNEQWESFEAIVFADINPSDTQRIETKKGFIAGVFSMLCSLKEISSDKVSEQKGVKYLEQLSADCIQFSKDNLADFIRRN